MQNLSNEIIFTVFTYENFFQITFVPPNNQSSFFRGLAFVPQLQIKLMQKLWVILKYFPRIFPSHNNWSI